MKGELEILTEVANAAAAFKAHAVYLHPESSRAEEDEFIRDRSRLNEALNRWRVSNGPQRKSLTSARVKG